MAKARSKRGAAMVMVIIATVLFTMMSFSLITASSTLYSSANRKWTQLLMEQQAISVGRVFSDTLTNSVATDLSDKMNDFLDRDIYSSYVPTLTGEQSIYSFQTYPSSDDLPAGYGKVIIRLKKIPYEQGPPADEQIPINATYKDSLDEYLDSVTYVDYQLTAMITVVSPEDEQALGTAEVSFFRVKQYEAQYFKNSKTEANRIYPDSEWNFFTTSEPTEMDSSTLVPPTEIEQIVTFTPSEPKHIYYTVAEVRYEVE